MKFSNLGLSASLCNRIPYKEPTAIQKAAIPQILRGMDILASAQTGTGKTAAYLYPLVDIFLSSPPKIRLPRGIILEPTRELALQVNEELIKCRDTLRTALIVGGESILKQERILKTPVDILIATPGRLLDLIERERILLIKIKHIVIDEADKMLDMGFIPDIKALLSQLPSNRQTLFFSATFSPEIENLAKQYALNPKRIHIENQGTTSKTIQHFKTLVSETNKYLAVKNILSEFSKKERCFIFCNQKINIDTLVRFLEKEKLTARSLHGGMIQSQRNLTLEAFKNNDFSLLVASDVAARGIDVDGLEYVINFDVPMELEDYIHRVGRTGRAGKTGKAFTLVTEKEEKKWRKIEEALKTPVETFSFSPKEEKKEKKEQEEKVIKKKAPSLNENILGFGDAPPAFFSVGF